MEAYLCERTANLKRRMAIHKVFRERFFQPEVLAGSYATAVESSESEHITTISMVEGGGTVDVTTSGVVVPRRYRMKSVESAWLIYRVEDRCILCGLVESSRNCTACKGSGWLTKEEFKKAAVRLTNIDFKKNISRPERDVRGELEENFSNNISIHLFMRNLFEAEEDSRRRQLLIFEELERFFSDRAIARECDAAPPAHQGVQRITSIDSFADELRVVTEQATVRVRYRLKPTGNSWIVTEVEIECPSCRRNGPTPSCLLCQGTSWFVRFASKSGDLPPGGDFFPSPPG